MHLRGWALVFGMLAQYIGQASGSLAHDDTLSGRDISIDVDRNGKDLLDVDVDTPCGPDIDIDVDINTNGNGNGHGWGGGPPNPGKPQVSIVYGSLECNCGTSQTSTSSRPPPPTTSYVPPVYPTSTSSKQQPTTSATPPSSPPNGNACPPDSSAPKSPGLRQGDAAKSMIDSINYMRRLYNPNCKCLKWSAGAAAVADDMSVAGNEALMGQSAYRAFGVVSAPDYGQYFSGALATTRFEASMFWMLCQRPGDPQLKGQCNGQTGEANCNSGACDGHAKLIIDTPDTYNYMGCGTRSWLSCAFVVDP